MTEDEYIKRHKNTWPVNARRRKNSLGVLCSDFEFVSIEQELMKTIRPLKGN